ncbi:MAG: DUF6356 family protein [Alphaproteobacteria bacterium]|nr:DUF6356 family protein [Alphaproteobacteria bacterium]
MFVEHPKSVDETYFEHLIQAFTFAFLMISGGLACLIHGLVPGLITRFASRTINHLFQCMVQNREGTKGPNRGETSFSESDVTDSP